jgi:hypothetical protein
VQGEPSLQAAGVLEPDFLHGLQGAQFSGAAAGGTRTAGLHLLLPVEQQELWVLLTQGCQGSMELQDPACAGNQDLPPSECQVIKPGAKISGVGDQEC